MSNNERVPKNKEIKIDALLGVFLSEKPKMAPQFCTVKMGSWVPARVACKSNESYLEKDSSDKKARYFGLIADRNAKICFKI